MTLGMSFSGMYLVEYVFLNSLITLVYSTAYFKQKTTTTDEIPSRRWKTSCLLNKNFAFDTKSMANTGFKFIRWQKMSFRFFALSLWSRAGFLSYKPHTLYAPTRLTLKYGENASRSRLSRRFGGGRALTTPLSAIRQCSDGNRW